MSTDYFFTNKTNTEVKKLDLLDLSSRLYDFDCTLQTGIVPVLSMMVRSVYKYNDGMSVDVTHGMSRLTFHEVNNWTWFYQDEEMTWAKDFGESNSEPLLDKIAEWLDINWHSEHSELPEIKTFIEQHDLWSAWREASHSHG